MSKVLQPLGSFFKLATADFANQYALPVKSATGFVVSKWTAKESRHLNRLLIDNLNITPNDYLLELGYGRGETIRLAFEKISTGSGMVFGIERSGYMVDVARKRLDLEIEETRKIRFDRVDTLRHIPYPTNLFDHVYHTDVFYFIDRLPEVFSEVHRILKPAAKMTCAMQMKRLESLTENGILNESQWNPLRCLEAMKYAGFEDVKIEYHKDSVVGEYQILSGRKTEKELDSEEIMERLQMDIKKEMLMKAMSACSRSI